MLVIAVPVSSVVQPVLLLGIRIGTLTEPPGRNIEGIFTKSACLVLD